MGTVQLESLAGLDLAATPVYCLGFSKDIVDASDR